METKKISIDKAIGRLRSYLRWRKPDADDCFWEAAQMGMDGLQQCKYNRNHPQEPKVRKLKCELN